MAELVLKGVYGSALTVDDDGVTFHAKGRMAKGALGADERRIRFDAVTDRSFKPANIATNGQIVIVTDNGKSVFHFMTGKAARAAQEAFDVIVARTSDAGTVTAGRGYTTKTGVEGATLKSFVTEVREAREAFKADMRALQEGVQEQRLAALFPGLTFDAETVTYGGVTQPIAGATAVVDTAGSLERRPTLSRVAIGGVLFGALGAVGGGLLQKKEDGRQVFLLIDGPLAAWAVPTGADQYGDATRFAALFNTAAKAATVAAAAEEQVTSAAVQETSGASGLTERLTALSNLHAQGLLDDSEFAAAKAAVIAGN